MDPIIDPDDLKTARKEGLDEIERLTVQMAKRAPRPAFRQAMAEFEATIQRIRQEWGDKGLIDAA